MRRLFYISGTIILTLAQGVFSQSNPSIEQWQEIIKSMKNSIEKVDTLNSFSIYLIKENPDQAMNNFREAYQIAQTIDYTAGEKTAVYYISSIYKLKSQLDSAIIFTNKYIALGRISEDSVVIARGYLVLGNILRRKGELESARDYFIEARNIFALMNEKQGLISVMNSLGIIFRNTSQFDSAAFYYLNVLQLSEELNFDIGKGSAMINLGNVYMDIGEDSLAESFYMKSIPINAKINDNQKIALAYTNIGILNTKSLNYDSAMFYYDKAIEMQNHIGSIIDVNNLYLNQSSVYKEKKEYDTAIEKCNLALNAFSEIGYIKGSITALYCKAEIISKLGLYKQATALLDSSLSMAKKLGDLHLQKEIFNVCFLNSLAAKQYENAIENRTKYFLISDSILSLSKQEYIADLNHKYEKNKDQTRILTLTNENLEKDLKINKRTNQRNIFLFSSAGIVLIAIFVLVLYRSKTKSDNLIAMQKISQLEKDKKLISVQFLMEGQENERRRIAKELHDGIGVLLSTAKMQFTSIDGLSPNSRPKINNATKLLEMAASEVRKITHNLMPGLLTKYGFFEAVDDLIDQINDAETIEAEFVVEGQQNRFSETREFMLYRMVQEMINNTLKHAQASKVKIRVVAEDDNLLLQYHDNGKGFNVYEKLNNQAIGLTSLNSRANYLGGDLKLESSPGQGTKYELMISIV